jgi:hypothetical protein
LLACRCHCSFPVCRHQCFVFSVSVLVPLLFCSFFVWWCLGCSVPLKYCGGFERSHVVVLLLCSG